MNTKQWQKKIDAYFDGRDVDVAEVEALITERPECAAYLADLEGLRQATAHTVRRETIADAQFRAFMDPIHDAIETPRRRFGGYWATLSLGAAAVIIAVATWSIFTPGPEPVKATEVEFVSTDLDGATVEWYDSEDGITTLEVNVSEDYVW